uniref:Cadherin domain-containing protein n=1 Tax=Astyanax mexicanus TaxID=7994 RepID=A0A8B9GNJ1_ASTMX
MVGTMARQVLLFVYLLSLSSVRGQVSYSIPEEMPKGSLVGNIAQDLGLDLKRLKSGKARIYTGDSAEYIELNKERGVLLIKERIDREALCRQTMPCALHFQIILENPMELFRVTIEITDINDNSPVFEKSEIKFRISESAVIGSKFALERAMDPDVGVNDLQSYALSPKENFSLKIKNQPDGTKLIEMVLQTALDREKLDEISLILTAVDGGDPKLSGTAQIYVTVLDVNDNAPIFSLPLYKSTVNENALKGTILGQVSASDADRDGNGDIIYSITNTMDNVRDIFDVNANNGEIMVRGQIDFEKARHYEIHIQATDEGGLTDSCKMLVDVLDVNDNIPSVNVLSMSKTIIENSKPGTVVAMLNIQDPDSEQNGQITCSINDNLPLALKSASDNFYSLVTDTDLDRESESGYNISIMCSDEGSPSLSSSVTLTLQISDVNDNAPVFERSSYEASISENNTPGLSLFRVKARDADWNQNARVSFILQDSSVNGVSVSCYVSVSADTGVIHAVRSYDYEQIKDFNFRV